MPDNLQRYGFRPFKGQYSSEEKVEVWPVATAYQAAPGAVNVPLRVGDPVSRVSDGTVALTGAGSAAKTYGVIVGIKQIYDPAIGAVRSAINVPGGTAWTGLANQTQVLVAPVKGRIFEIDCDDAVTATTQAAFQAHRGANCDIAHGAVLNTGAFPRADISTVNTTNTLQLNIVDISPIGDNQFYDGNYVKLLVQFNLVDDNHGLPQTTGV
jgi:hypothetical protein